MTPFLQIHGLQIDLGTFHLSVDAEFASDWTGLFGPSGAGKTTLLEIIAGLRRPQSGRLLVGEEVLFDAEKKIFVPPHRRGIGYVPQDLALFPHLTVRENLAYGQKGIQGGASTPSLESICDRLEIGSFLDKKPGALSGGEKQRVAFARALLARPKLLLLDEPLSGLDQPLKDRVLPLLLQIRDEFHIPTLYVTHAADEVMALCRHLAVLRDGKITAIGTPSDLFASSPILSYRLRED